MLFLGQSIKTSYNSVISQSIPSTNDHIVFTSNDFFQIGMF